MFTGLYQHYVIVKCIGPIKLSLTALSEYYIDDRQGWNEALNICVNATIISWTDLENLNIHFKPFFILK